MKSNRGFTLVEIMVVVVILGILASIVVPKLMGRPEQARRTQAGVQIKSISDALYLFKIDNGFYPSTEQGLKALMASPTTGKTPKNYRSGGYMDEIPTDPWGNHYAYLSPGLDADFDLISYGADGQPGGDGDDADISNTTKTD